MTMNILYYYLMTSLSPVSIFSLKSILPVINIATPASFGYHLLRVFFPSLYSKLHVSLKLT